MTPASTTADRPGSTRSVWYRVAGRTVGVDRRLPELELFELPAGGAGGSPPAPGPLRSQPGSRWVHRGSGWIADRQRSIECRLDATAYRLAVGGIGELWVRLDGRGIGCSRLASGLDPALARLALLGPALTLALAAQGTFGLHASAVEAGEGVLAFAGESGAGKSTLARTLAGSAALDYRRVADDLLPLDVETRPTTARADFPQLKLERAEQPFLSGLCSLPLRAVFLLEPPAAGSLRATVEIEPLARKAATLALIRHTVASRLFDARLLERHLQAAAALAESVPVRRLAYPWGAGSPVPIAEAIESCHLERRLHP